MIQALIFDFFGVIRPNDHGVRATYRLLGGDTSANEIFIADIIAAGNYGLIADADAQIAARLGVSLQTWREALGTQHNDQALLAFIAETRARTDYKMGLLSNSNAHMLSAYFEPGEVGRYFDAAVLSGDVGMAKPEAAFYRLIAHKLSVDPSACIMIDDRAEYCDGARRVGMQTIEYHDFDQFQTELAGLFPGGPSSI